MSGVRMLDFFHRLMKIHLNPPILLYNGLKLHVFLNSALTRGPNYEFIMKLENELNFQMRSTV